MTHNLFENVKQKQIEAIKEILCLHLQKNIFRGNIHFQYNAAIYIILRCHIYFSFFNICPIHR